MFRSCKVIIRLALQHFKKNYKTENARNETHFYKTVSHIFVWFCKYFNRIKADEIN